MESDADRFKRAVIEGNPLALAVWGLMGFVWSVKAWREGTSRYAMAMDVNAIMGEWPRVAFHVGGACLYLHMYSLARDAYASLWTFEGGALVQVDALRLVDGHLPKKMRVKLATTSRAALNRQLDVAWSSPPCPDCKTEAPHDAGGSTTMMRVKGKTRAVPVTTCRSLECQRLATKEQKSVTTIQPAVMS